MGSRAKDQADYDLERVIDMFDTALTSKDERVTNTLRSLLMIVTLTASESQEEGHGRNSGPLRRLFEDVHHLNTRLYRLEDEIRALNNTRYNSAPQSADFAKALAVAEEMRIREIVTKMPTTNWDQK